MPGIIPGISDDLDERIPVLLLLADGFVVKDHATNGLGKTGCGDEPFPIVAAGLLGLGNPQFGKAFVAGGMTFVNRQHSFVSDDQCLRGFYQQLLVHFRLLRFQF
jgi:hypothetical protein